MNIAVESKPVTHALAVVTPSDEEEKVKKQCRDALQTNVVNVSIVAERRDRQETPNLNHTQIE